MAYLIPWRISQLYVVKDIIQGQFAKCRPESILKYYFTITQS